MNVPEAARRLGVAEHLVSTVDEHPCGRLVALRDGRTMLVTDTVARAYVPDVDDVLQDADGDPIHVLPPVANEERVHRGTGVAMEAVEAVADGAATVGELTTAPRDPEPTAKATPKTQTAVPKRKGPKGGAAR